ncbi:hypothetical protein SARC_15451, partial [Sphaeroforma arctica JP610]
MPALPPQTCTREYTSSYVATPSCAYTQVLVPDIVFYDNQQHTQIMSEMLKDYQLGEHILLVGNQGVGKNKVVDRFLQ